MCACDSGVGRMDFADATRVTAYIKHPHEAPVFDAGWPNTGCRRGQWSPHPTICRGELLFEIELDAVSARA